MSAPGYDGVVSRSPLRKHDPAKPVATREELEGLLLAGLSSGETRPMKDDDWERLRRQARVGTDHDSQ